MHEFLIPLVDVGGLAAGVIVVTGAGGVVLVVRAPFDHLAQDGLVDLCRRKGTGSVLNFVNTSKVDWHLH